MVTEPIDETDPTINKFGSTQYLVIPKSPNDNINQNLLDK